MRKGLLQLAYMGAIALVGSVCFSACSDDKNDPSYNENEVTEVKEAIPVQLVLSVSTGNQATTRMTAANVQADNSFRGINDAHFYTFAQANDGKHLPAAATATNLIDFSMLYSQGAISDNTNTSNRILEMALPIGSNTVVFYAKAPHTATNNTTTGISGSAQQGSVTANYNNNLANITFTMNPRMTNYSDYELNQKLFSAVLSRIVISALADTYKTVSVDSKNPIAVTGTEYPIVGGAAQGSYKLFWADYIKTVNTSTTPATISYGKSPFDNSKDMKPLEKTLADTYYEFSTIQQIESTLEIRGGSTAAITRVIADLWTAMNKIILASPTDKAEAVARKMALKIVENIGTYFDGCTYPGGLPNPEVVPETSVNFKSIATIAQNISDFYTPAIISNTYFNNLLDHHINIANFPYSFDVPAGAAELRIVNNDLSDIASTDESYNWFLQLKNNGNGESSLGTKLKTIGYLINLNPSAMSGGTITAENYIFPAELYYFGNSPLRVSDKTLTNADFPNGVVNWNTGGSETLWGKNNWVENGHVTSSTKSVAVKYNINYGTALMNTKIKYGAASLKDNNAAIQSRNGRTEADKSIAVNGANKPFVFTGVVIGGQPHRVGWNFLPTSASDFKYYIYDRDFQGAGTGDSEAIIPSFNNNIASTTTSAPLYTMLWDNYNPGGTGSGTQDDQLPVYVAVEFRNDGDDFWGRDNLVRHGGTFYIIGKLTPKAYNSTSEKSGYNTDLTWPDAATTAYPPYDTTDGTTKQIRRVFMQDYTTDVTFIIGENSLKQAYMTLPDLRSGQMSLGLSVDIEWRPGLVYEGVVLGEDNPSLP